MLRLPGQVPGTGCAAEITPPVRAGGVQRHQPPALAAQLLPVLDQLVPGAALEDDGIGARGEDAGEKLLPALGVARDVDQLESLLRELEPLGEELLPVRSDPQRVALLAGAVHAGEYALRTFLVRVDRDEPQAVARQLLPFRFEGRPFGHPKRMRVLPARNTPANMRLLPSR